MNSKINLMKIPKNYLKSKNKKDINEILENENDFSKIRKWNNIQAFHSI